MSESEQRRNPELTTPIRGLGPALIWAPRCSKLFQSVVACPEGSVVLGAVHVAF